MESMTKVNARIFLVRDCSSWHAMWGHGMTRDDEIKIHSDRATAEIDMALRAKSLQAARAHFGLTALHLARMRDLAGPAAEPAAEPAAVLAAELL